jgi:hypothetical protein
MESMPFMFPKSRWSKRRILRFWSGPGTRAVCVTLDHDFHTHLALAGSGHPSVVLLRVEGIDAEAQADLIKSVCQQFESTLAEGAAISADTRSVRVRRLPLK